MSQARLHVSPDSSREQVQGQPTLPGSFPLDGEDSLPYASDQVVGVRTPPTWRQMPHTPPSFRGPLLTYTMSSSRDNFTHASKATMTGRPILTSNIHPPTPELTPPRHRDSLSLPSRHNESLRASSSFADSFQTAREVDLPSDVDSNTDTAVPLHSRNLPGMHTWLDSASNVSLHTAIPQASDAKMPTHASAAEKSSPSPSWGSPASSADREWDQDQVKNVVVHRSRPKQPTLIKTRRLLRQSPAHATRVSDGREDDEAVEELHPTEAVANTVLASGDHSHAANMRDMNASHFDSVSASPIIAAVVVDNSPRIQPRLRHVSKTLSLRGAPSSDTTDDQYDVLMEYLEPPRVFSPIRKLSHKKHLIPYGYNSFSSKNTSSPRPGTAPDKLSPGLEHGHGSFLRISSSSKSPNGTRTVSAPLPGNRHSNTDSSYLSQTWTGDRDSSPSSSDGELLPLTPVDSGPSARLRHVGKFSNSDDDHEDLHARRASLFRSPSTAADHISPVSGNRSSYSGQLLGSLLSQTPDPLEITEATAVPIYIHNNNSVLVVHQLTSDEAKEDFSSTSVAKSSHLQGMLSVQSGRLSPDSAERNYDPPYSPLTNPRPVPELPLVTVIPPTPARDLDHLDAEAQRMRRTTRVTSEPKRSNSLLQRARRYSDNLIEPLATLTWGNGFGSLRRGTSLRKSALAPSVGDASQRDNNLHPFWRPRHFWDDLSDSEFEDDYDDDESPYDDEYDRLPAGGDTSDLPEYEIPRPTTSTDNHGQKSSTWRRGGSLRGFLIGNSLGLERGPTNRRRHIINVPAGKQLRRQTASSPGVAPAMNARMTVRESARHSSSRRRGTGSGVSWRDVLLFRRVDRQTQEKNGLAQPRARLRQKRFSAEV